MQVVARDAPLAAGVQAPGERCSAVSAATALPGSEPKLIAEMFTSESGRKACRRPRAAPSALAHGTHASVPTRGFGSGATGASVRCRTSR